MYNLSKVLDEHTEVSHALSDSDLKSNMEVLEKQYLDGSKQNVSVELISSKLNYPSCSAKLCMYSFPN